MGSNEDVDLADAIGTIFGAVDGEVEARLQEIFVEQGFLRLCPNCECRVYHDEDACSGCDRPMEERPS